MSVVIRGPIPTTSLDANALNYTVEELKVLGRLEVFELQLNENGEWVEMATEAKGDLIEKVLKLEHEWQQSLEPIEPYPMYEEDLQSGPDELREALYGK